MQIRTAFSKLKKTNEITVKATNKNTLVTVVKYNDYQSKSTNNNKQGNKQITIKQQSNNNQITTTNNNNNNNKKNNTIGEAKKFNSDSYKKELLKYFYDFSNNNGLDFEKVKEQLKTAYEFYEELNFKNSKGRKVINLKTTIKNNWFKKEDLHKYKNSKSYDFV